MSLQPSRKMGTFIVLLSPLKYHVKATQVSALAQAQGLPGMRQVLVEVSKRFSWLKKKPKNPTSKPINLHSPLHNPETVLRKGRELMAGWILEDSSALTPRCDVSCAHWVSGPCCRTHSPLNDYGACLSAYSSRPYHFKCWQ